MSRPMYESSTDTHNEKCIASFYLARQGDRHRYDGFNKLPISYGVDYVFTRAGIVACWVEIKNRPAIKQWGQYDSIMLSVLKWESGIKHYDATRRAFRFIVRAGDGTVAAYNFHDEDRLFPVEWGGRTVQYRDNGDVEPVVMIPLKNFFVVGNLAESEL